MSGVGANSSVEGNHGAMTYSVGIDVPQGFEGVTPEVALSYSSNSGNGALGMGWSLPGFSIERMTSKGLQRYGVEDRFVAEGSDELVRVAQSGDSATYRSRFESGFVRYTWLNRGTGEGGAWKAEYPDGRVGYFGADENAVAVGNARVTVPTTPRVFRWHLVALVDRFGHQMRATWTKDTGGTALLERLDYVFEGSQPRHSVRFVYEARPDTLSDAKPGFELRLTQRLKEVRVFSSAEVIRSYAMTYEAEAMSGGASRLARVTRTGRSGGVYPVTFNFAYSKTLDGACTGDCEKPFVKSMGTLGVNFTQGLATLLDINGDALPDVLSTSPSGVHSFYLAHLDAEGRVSFSTTPVQSARTGSSSSLVLGNATVQVLDLDGDGFVDITNARSGEVLCNKGQGDWTADPADCKPTASAVAATYELAEADDPTQLAPKYVRFFDYDHDKRIDFLRTDLGGTTSVLANTPAGYVAVTATSIGQTFDASGLQLADMNGDGLQDPVVVVASGNAAEVSYRLNLGFGDWTDWRTVTVGGFNPSQLAVIELQDLNGDELTDLVAVVGNEVKLALNRNGDRFDTVRALTTADLGSGVVPSRAPDTVVSYADMNGNGSSDIVWVEAGGAISYLELFPVRPNLLARITNGVGGVERISYGSSILEQARDELASQPWTDKVPNPMTLVTATERFVTLTGDDMDGAAAPTGLVERTSYRYHSGFYDGVEKQFRGYAGVERQLDSDLSRDAQEPGLVVETYDVGKSDPLLAGRLLTSKTWAGAAPNRALLTESRSLWQACAVAQTSTFFACSRATTTIITERDAANAVTTRDEQDYDGYGNVTASRALGVVHLGTPEAPRACAPCVASGTFGDACGDQCLGDEAYTETDFIDPAGALWLVGREREERMAAVAGAWEQVERTYYDGTDFEGRPLGELTLGNVTRLERKLGDAFITVARARFDAHGNAVETLDALGTAANTSSHRRQSTFDAAGLRLTRTEVLVGSADVDALRMDFTTDAAWELESQSSNWYPVKGGAPVVAPQQTRYRYDEHGRLATMLRPGDTEANPGVTFAYELADPSSRVLLTTRTSTNAGDDLVEAVCLDGLGRTFQRRARLSATRWQVDGFLEFDARGQPVRRYQPYIASSGACEVTPPANVPSTRFVYDPTGRMLRETEPDGAYRSMVYGPLVTRSFDEDDNDPADPFTNTPDVRTFDGLGRVTSVARQLTTGGALSVHTIGYDALGLLATVRDPAGHLRTQTADRFGRVIRVDDTNGGATTFTYDAEGNAVQATDARQVSSRQDFDGANRLVARYDPANDAATRVTYAYDTLPGCTECTNGGNRVVQLRWPEGSGVGERRFGYDARENPVFEQRFIKGHALATRRRFDLAMREIGVTHPDGTSIDTTLDGLGRATAVSGAVSLAEYTERGVPSKVTFANGTDSVYAYDGRVRLTSLTTTGPDGALLQLGYTLSKSGDLTALADGALPGRVRRASQFTLDGWGRASRVVLSDAAGEEALEFGFDAVDNITSATSSLGAASRAHVGDFTYDATRPNAVTTAGGRALTYDAAGALTARDGATFTRDFRGRLVAASSARLEATYAYDDFGRSAKQEGDSATYYVSPGFELRDGIATSYAFFDNERVKRTQTDALAATLLSDLAPASGDGPLTVTGDGSIDIADAWLAQAAALNLVQLSGGPAPSATRQLLRSAARRLLMEDAVWLHRDHLDTAVIATDAEGAVRGERSYYPTGALREAIGYVDERGFTDQEVDEATGLLHFDFRELDTQTGRWDRPDPAFLVLMEEDLDAVGEFNSGYAYVANQLSSATDPTGLNLKSLKTRAKASLARTGAKLSTFKGNAAAFGRSAKTGTGKAFTKVGKGAVKLGKAGMKKGGEFKDWVKKKDANRMARNEALAVHRANNPRTNRSDKLHLAVTGLSVASGIMTVIEVVDSASADSEEDKLKGLGETSQALAVLSGVISVGSFGSDMHTGKKLTAAARARSATASSPSSSAPRRASTSQPSTP